MKKSSLLVRMDSTPPEILLVRQRSDQLSIALDLKHTKSIAYPVESGTISVSGSMAFTQPSTVQNNWRRIRFKDPETSKKRVFLINNTALPTLTIETLYKSRWQAELFFQWIIKQHLRIKRLLGTSEIAVKTETRCAVATDVMIAIVKKELELDASLSICQQILSVPNRIK